VAQGRKKGVGSGKASHSEGGLSLQNGGRSGIEPSVENDIFGGFGVYVVFAILSVLALRLATRLPSKIWEQHEPEHGAVLRMCCHVFSQAFPNLESSVHDRLNSQRVSLGSVFSSHKER
jgi:hypothetical protein